MNFINTPMILASIFCSMKLKKSGRDCWHNGELNILVYLVFGYIKKGICKSICGVNINDNNNNDMTFS